jgi:hypothetical protein
MFVKFRALGELDLRNQPINSVYLIKFWNGSNAFEPCDFIAYRGEGKSQVVCGVRCQKGATHLEYQRSSSIKGIAHLSPPRVNSFLFYFVDGNA